MKSRSMGVWEYRGTNSDTPILRYSDTSFLSTSESGFRTSDPELRRGGCGPNRLDAPPSPFGALTVPAA